MKWSIGDDNQMIMQPIACAELVLPTSTFNTTELISEDFKSIAGKIPLSNEYCLGPSANIISHFKGEWTKVVSFVCLFGVHLLFFQLNGFCRMHKLPTRRIFQSHNKWQRFPPKRQRLQDSRQFLLPTQHWECTLINKQFSGQAKMFIDLHHQMTMQTAIYFNGMKRELWVAPIPGRPCLTGL